MVQKVQRDERQKWEKKFQWKQQQGFFGKQQDGITQLKSKG